MASSTKWLSQLKTGTESFMNSKIIFSTSQVGDLALAILNPPFAAITISGDYTKWCSNLLYYPFNLTKNETTIYTVNIGGVTYKKVKCYGEIPINHYFGYTLGELKIPKFETFLEIEPYTKYTLYLPYYGFIDLRSYDINNKYLQFRLFIDYNTGQAQYVIGVSDVSIPNSSEGAPFIVGQDNTNMRIIGQYSFQIGYEIPLGSVGMAETLRNIALSSIKLGGALTMGAFNVKSANAIGKVQAINNAKDSLLGSGFSGAMDVLSSFQLNPQIDKPNNTFINSATCESIILIKKRITPTIDMTNLEYCKQYGLPLNELRKLNEINGFTIIYRFFVEGAGFENITEDEKSELKSILTSGVILPDKPSYTITEGLTGCTSSGNPTTILEEVGVETLQFNANSGYKFGSSPVTSLTNAEVIEINVTDSLVVVKIGKATNNVTIEVVATPTKPISEYVGSWLFNEELNYVENTFKQGSYSGIQAYCGISYGEPTLVDIRGFSLTSINFTIDSSISLYTTTTRDPLINEYSLNAQYAYFRTGGYGVDKTSETGIKLRTININENATAPQEFLTWLKNNAVKQE